MADTYTALLWAYGPMGAVFAVAVAIYFLNKGVWKGDPSEFRTCSVSGFKVHKPVEPLIITNLVTSVLFLLLGGIMALGVLLTRWPTAHILSEEWFYRALTMHGLAMLVFWIVFFEMALIYFGASVVLNSRFCMSRTAWIGYGLMLLGSVVVTGAVLSGNATTMFTTYPPLQAHHLYYWGVIVFAVGIFLALAAFFTTVMVAQKEVLGGKKTTLPLFVYGLAAGSIIAYLTLFHGAAFYFPTWLWSMGTFENLDAGIYRLIFWGFGHSSQQINVCMMVATWYFIGSVTVGATPMNQKVCRTAFVLYVLFICIASEHHILVDPGFSPAHKAWNTGYFMHLAVLASMIHGLAVPAAIENGLRKKGYTNGLFEWLKKAPWENPVFSACALSIVGFGFLGGITGVIFGTEQLNIISHNTWRIPGHFHGTVVSGTSLAFMGLTYYIIRVIGKKELTFKKLAAIQPYLFGIGAYILSFFMMFAGGFGVPRRHWDITFADSMVSFIGFNPVVALTLTVVVIGGLLATVGGAIYILVTLSSLWGGEEVKAEAK